jgi:hypothetical protein
MTRPELNLDDPKYWELAPKMVDVASPAADIPDEPDYDGDPDLAEQMIADSMSCRGTLSD